MIQNGLLRKLMQILFADNLSDIIKRGQKYALINRLATVHEPRGGAYKLWENPRFSSTCSRPKTPSSNFQYTF